MEHVLYTYDKKSVAQLGIGNWAPMPSADFDEAQDWWPRPQPPRVQLLPPPPLSPPRAWKLLVTPLQMIQKSRNPGFP